MGTYISRSDVETVFGVANVAKWSDKDRDNAEVNADNVAAAIAEAEAEIDDRFRSSRYVVPLTGTTGTLYTVKQWASRLTGFILYSSRGLAERDKVSERMIGIRDAVHEEIDTYLAGQRSLAATLAYPEQPTAPIVT